MKNSRAIVFPLLAILLATGVWFFQNQGGTPQIGDSNTGLTLPKDESDGEIRSDPTEPREVVATAVAERREDVTESSGEPAAYTAALGGLRGRIVREKGKEPMPGVEVLGIELRVDVVLPTIDQAMEFLDGPNPVKFRVKTRTDGDGRFVLRGLHPRAIHLLGIGLKTEDASVRFVDHTPDRGETVDLGDIVIETRGSLRGVVQDSQGKPVAGARVRALDIPQIAFQAGIGDFRPDGCAFVIFNEMSFVVAPPPWIAELDRLLPFAETTSDATGAFDLDGVRPGMVTVLVQAPGKVPLTRATRVQPEQERNVGTLRLARPATLQLTFVDTNDQPVTTVRAAAGRLLAMTPVGLTEAPEGASADGTVKLSGLTRGKLYAIWQREDGAPWNVVGPLHDGDTKKIVVPAAVVGRVTVVSDKGEPVTKGVELAATYALGGVSEDIPIPGFLPKVRRDRIRPVAGEPGVWTIEGLVPGTWNLRARAEGFSFGGARMIVNEGGAPEAKITLAPSTHASFLVVDSGGAPIQGARVYWNARRGMPESMRERMPRSPIPFMLGKTDAKGMLVADGVPVGATRFAVRHPAFAVAEVREQPVRADVPIRVELRGAGDLELTVTERGVRPPEIVSLIVLPRFSGDIEPLVPPIFVRTDDQGKVVIHGMQPGKWRIQEAPPLRDLVSPNDFMKLMMVSRFRGTRSEVTILEGQLVRSSFERDGDTQRLTYTGSIHFKIHKNGRPLQGAVVGVNGTSSDSATTDAQGMCSIDHLQDGTYWVSVNVGDTLPPMTLWSDNVTLKDGQRVDRIVDIMTGGARVSVRDLSGLPLSGVSVQIRAEGGGWRGSGGLTDDAGVVEVAELAEGDYTCRVDLRETDRESMIVPAVKLVVRHAQVATVELRAIKPVKVAGTVVLDVSSLTGRARELALENKPNGGQFISEDSGSSNNWRSWQRFREWDDALLEAPLRELTLAPGSYNFQTWGSSLQWTCAPLSVIAPSMPAMRIVLRPDQATLDALVKADADAKAKKNTQGK